MTDYVSQYENPETLRDKYQIERLVAAFDTMTTVTAGIVRWNSNQQIPPQDLLDLWHRAGKEFSYPTTSRLRQEEEEAALAYRIEQWNAHVRGTSDAHVREHLDAGKKIP
jgi:hypothetical protein